MSQGNSGDKEMPEDHPTVWNCSFSICLRAATHTYSTSPSLPYSTHSCVESFIASLSQDIRRDNSESTSNKPLCAEHNKL